MIYELAEETRRALQKCADVMLPTDDPFLRPYVFYSAATGGLTVRLEFEQSADFDIDTPGSAEPEYVKSHLLALKRDMIAKIRGRIDAWEKE